MAIVRTVLLGDASVLGEELRVSPLSLMVVMMRAPLLGLNALLAFALNLAIAWFLKELAKNPNR
eukprot:1493790-Amphidinium_carterae.3